MQFHRFDQGQPAHSAAGGPTANSTRHAVHHISELLATELIFKFSCSERQNISSARPHHSRIGSYAFKLYPCISPCNFSKYVAVFCSFLLGFGDSCFNTQVCLLMISNSSNYTLLNYSRFRSIQYLGTCSLKIVHPHLRYSNSCRFVSFFLLFSFKTNETVGFSGYLS